MCIRDSQYPLRGDERHDTAVTHGIQSFEKEIVVDGFLGGASSERVAPLKLRVEHGNVTEQMCIRDSLLPVADVSSRLRGGKPSYCGSPQSVLQ